MRVAATAGVLGVILGMGSLGATAPTGDGAPAPVLAATVRDAPGRSSGGDSSQNLSPFLGLTPPEDVPVVFQLARTPGFFPTDRIAISHDGREIYFSETTGRDWSSCRVSVYQFEDGEWRGPRLLFAGPYYAPALSADERTMFLDGPGAAYVSKRTAAGWSTPEALPVPVSYLQVTETGQRYASAMNAAGGVGGFDIVRYGVGPSGPTIESLGPPLDSPGGEGGFSISRDESFVILTAARGGIERPDLFVSFRTSDGAWTEPMGLGPTINTLRDDYGAYVTSDGKYLFFSRCNASYTDGDVYWVRIDRLLAGVRPSGLSR